ncbi:hypothetical protein [Rhizobium leguminosarum]|uniref:hypothetical protein n=1 Tax=Rhizobium leguminosarum TaxID=384 RepID=UPI00102F7E82|nr:hypothetical protein [Rhizobium leguminosarum]TAU35410.1 hypothetical protein ELI43_36365 [Rhizobium leguminosarum]TBE37949.1 hypothetical protein ELH04_37025 [Rhizobium leguminosarum]
MPPIQRLPKTRKPLTDIGFIFDSYRDLTEKLGAVDGHAATLALAARYFTDQSRLSTDDQALGLSLAPGYGVSTRYVDLNNLSVHLNQLLIVATTKHAEDFLIRFRREQVALGREWRGKDDGEDRLSFTLDCIGDGLAGNVERIGDERYRLLQYYRLVRNAAAHQYEKRSRLDVEFEKVRQFRDLVKDEYGLDAPNKFSDTQFDDHMLYTRLVKYLATDLCRLAPPETLEEFQRVLSNRIYFCHEPRSISKDKGDPERLKSSLSGFLKHHYNFQLDLYPTLQESLVQWIEDIPTKRIRRREQLGTLSDWVKNNVPS